MSSLRRDAGSDPGCDTHTPWKGYNSMMETLNSQRVWRRRMKFTVAALGGVAGAALAAGAGLGYYVADQITRPARPSPMDEMAMSPFETGADYENVTFPTARGDHAIHAWWLPRPETDRVIIGCV